MMTSFDNNKDKICLFLKNDVGGSPIRACARSHIRSHDPRSYDHGITALFYWQKYQSKVEYMTKVFII